MSKPLADVLNFGAIDADSDALLRECFQDHAAYVAARDHQAFLILGRKGSGKTAIFKKLVTDRSPDRFAYGHTFDDYPWQHHDLQAQTGVPEERRYIHSWKYLMLISLSKILLNIDQSQPWNDDALESLAALEDFVVDSYGSRDPDLRQLFSPDKELRFKTSFRLPFVAVEGQRLRIRDLPVHVQEVNSAMQFHVMRTMNPDHAYYICFDQLDLGFDPNQKEYSLRLIGLLLAARDLFLDARDEHKKKLSPVVFLRDDIYQDLQFEDKNKITENFMTEVEWRESEGTLTLKELMGSRFAEVLADGGEAVGWDDVFDESREMPSRQTKYKHICDRTFLRPRDMIKFCNEVLIAHKAGADQEAAKFGNAALHQARDPYSDYLLNELDDEIAKHVPDYREYLEVLKEVGSVQFTLTEFSANWRRRAALSQIEPAAGLASLFEFSVIGYLKPGGRGGGSEYVWRYLDPRARFNAGAESFRVHAGFKEALDLVRT